MLAHGPLHVNVYVVCSVSIPITPYAMYMCVHEVVGRLLARGGEAGVVDAAEWRELVPESGHQEALLGHGVLRFDGKQVGGALGLIL